MKKTLSILLVVIMALLIALTGCNSESKNDSEIRIGYVGPLTGDQAPWGLPELNMLKMLVEETNANGGVLGKKVKLYYYDNRADNVETQNAARRLIQEDKVVAIVGTNASGTSIALASVCERYKIPQLTTTATNAQVTFKDGKVRPYTFRTIMTDPQQGGIMAKYAYNVLKIKRVAILYEIGSDYSIGIKDAFKSAFEKYGGTITTIEAYKTGDVDFRAQLSRIKETNSDAIFLPALYKQVGLATLQARNLGITTQFLGTDCWYSKDIITLGGKAVDGAYFVQPIDINDPKLNDIKNKYKNKFNSNLLDMGTNGLYAYDDYMILIDSIKRAKKVDSVAIRDAIEKAKNVKTYIGTISISPTDHNTIRNAVIMKVENNKFKTITSYGL